MSKTKLKPKNGMYHKFSLIEKKYISLLPISVPNQPVFAIKKTNRLVCSALKTLIQHYILCILPMLVPFPSLLTTIFNSIYQ
ncbi:MAG TPA: hypothetical protein DCG42_07160 [Maribacter sp.]|nr:hypothetical protein [Maribacter sp.]|tara:strand:+ start:740 stop:985 length:246 start_codon:yes stop_codon:yes gene_type:complete